MHPKLLATTLLICLFGLAPTNTGAGEIANSEPVSFGCVKQLYGPLYVPELNRRIHEAWLPSSLGNASIAVQVGSDGSFYNVHFERKSGDAQFDADCLQAVLSCAKFAANAHSSVGRLDALSFDFDSQPPRSGIAIKRYFDDHPAEKGHSVCIYRIPIDVLERYKEKFELSDLDSTANLLVLKNESVNGSLNIDTTNRIVANYSDFWITFFVKHPHATKYELTKAGRSIH